MTTMCIMMKITIKGDKDVEDEDDDDDDDADDSDIDYED